jgi:hypothetical protein
VLACVVYVSQLSTHGYEYVKKLGEGTYGKVAMCRVKGQPETFVAIKRMAVWDMHLLDAKRVVRELRILR